MDIEDDIMIVLLTYRQDCMNDDGVLVTCEVLTFLMMNTITITVELYA
jgi:hypothetical protein